MGERADEITPRLDPVSGQEMDPFETEEGIGASHSGTDFAATPVAGTARGTGNGFDSSVTYGDTAESPDETDEVEATRSQIEQTRSHLGETIDAIQDKLSPSNLASQAKETVRDATIGKAQEMASNVGENARGAGSSLVQTIKENPVPAALAGIGIGWLISAMRKSSTVETGPDSSSYGYSGYRGEGGYSGRADYRSGGYSGQSYDRSSDQSMTDKAGQYVGQAQAAVGDTLGQVQDKAGQVTGQIQDKAGQVTGQIQDRAGQLGDQAQEQFSHLADNAQYGAQRARVTFQSTLRDNPLAVGAAAVALGLAAGLAIPETQKEHELMGETRDSLAEKARSTVQETAGKVQTVAQEAVGAAKQEAQDQHLV